MYLNFEIQFYKLQEVFHVLLFYADRIRSDIFLRKTNWKPVLFSLLCGQNVKAEGKTPKERVIKHGYGVVLQSLKIITRRNF